MGNKSSTKTKDRGDAGATATPSKKDGASAAAPAPEAVPEGNFDVAISATREDEALAQFIKGQLEGASIAVYCKPSNSEADAKVFGKILVDAKCLVFLASKSASTKDHCTDRVSLAYISNKPIIVASSLKKEEVIKNFEIGMKLTLESLYWTAFDSEEERATRGRQFVQLVQEQLAKPVAEATVETATAPNKSEPSTSQRRRARINTKLRSQDTAKELVDTTNETFFDRNFRDETEVAWFRFQQGFLTEYDSQLSALFTEDQVPWLLDMLKNDVFGGAEKISRAHFMTIRGNSPDKNAFWRTVSQIAVEKFNMQEVFNMKSTVRLTAIENLVQFQNPAVVEALILLLSDTDPNVRAVAAISLGRTGTSSDEEVIDHLIALLEDKDRIVRQSACLSLGHLKAEKAVPHIGHVWRNDFISVVRSAARTALELMDTESARKVLKVTKILEDEIKALEGEHAIV